MTALLFFPFAGLSWRLLSLRATCLVARREHETGTLFSGRGRGLACRDLVLDAGRREGLSAPGGPFGQGLALRRHLDVEEGGGLGRARESLARHHRDESAPV